MPDAGHELYDAITQAFSESFVNGRVDSRKLGAAATMIAPLYDRIFGQGFVSNHLKDDIIGHGKGLMRAAEQQSHYRWVDEMIPAMVKEKGIENIRGKWGEGVIECLWTKRALDFICRFLDYGIIRHPELSLYECATKAYQEVLRPYHGVMVSTIVSLAFRLAPKREKFLSTLGFHDLTSAQEKLKLFMAAAKPVIESVHQTLVSNGCDFPDIV